MTMRYMASLLKAARIFVIAEWYTGADTHLRLAISNESELFL